MKKFLEATQQTFESASYKTPQYMAWHQLFRREFTRFLNKLNITDIAISNPNHFDASGFFRLPTGQAFYFRIEDVRYSKENMLVRTVTHFKDYTGGRNQYVSLDNEESFIKGFCHITAIL